MLHKNSSLNLMKTSLIERKNVENKMINLSSFLLFEAADDSEGEFDHHHHHCMVMMGLRDPHNDYDVDDDDAQSCSYDAWDATSHVNDACRGRYRTNGTIVDDDNDDDDDDKFVDEYKVGMHSKVAYMRDDYKCTSEVVSTANSHNSRKSCIDSSGGKKMSEKERSRLFWETCLAS